MSPPTLGARYLAACVRLGVVEWRAGMLSSYGERCREVDRWGITWWGERGYIVTDGAVDGEVPDLSDSATMGCALAVAREAGHAPGMFVRPTATGWTVMRGSGAGMGKLSDGPSEAEALVQALERLAAERAAGGAP